MRTPSTATFRGTFTLLLCLILSPLACQVREAGDQNIIELPVDPTKMVLKAEALPLSNEQNSYGILVSWTPNEAVVLTRTETKRTLEGMEDFQRKFEFTASSHEYLDKDVIVGHQYSYHLQLKSGIELPEKFSKVRLKVPVDGEFQNPKNFKVLLGGHNWNRFYLNQTASLLPGDYTLNVDEFHAEKDAVFDLTGEGNPNLTIKTNKIRGSLTVVLPPTDDATKPFSLEAAFPD